MSVSPKENLKCRFFPFVLRLPSVIFKFYFILYIILMLTWCNLVWLAAARGLLEL